MCKIIIIPNASKIVDFDHFSKFAADILSSMPDGYGSVAMGEAGLFGIRTLSPTNYAYDVNIPEFCVNPTESFGVISKIKGAAMFHGRMSTNSISLNNTHPINRDDWSLIHNGVVTNHGEKYVMTTGNDSEHVLYNLINGGIDAIAANLTGYYAAGAIDPDGLLHVFRDDLANLYYAFSEKLDSPIFATDIDLIEEIGDYLGEELIGIKVKDNQYLVYDGKELIEHKEFVSRGYDVYTASHAGKSLGHDLPGIDTENYEGFTNNDDAPCYDAAGNKVENIPGDDDSRFNDDCDGTADDRAWTDFRTRTDVITVNRRKYKKAG